MPDLFLTSYNFFRPLYERTSFHRSVIDEVEDVRLKNAYAHVRKVVRHHAKTFYMAARFLPNEKQRGIFAIYGLCRYVDDLVDEAEGLLPAQRPDKRSIRLKLDAWKKNLFEAYEGKTQDHPVLIVFSNMLRIYNIPVDLPLELVEGVGMDLHKNRYQTFQEVYDYSYKVASTVGLMTVEVFGYESPEALRHAVDLGIAMQLTNMLRDVGEDLTKNRIYIPQEDLQRFGVTEAMLFERRITPEFRALMKFQIERARRYYRRSGPGIGMLHRDSRLPVSMAHSNYSRILNRIEANGYDVFNQRAHLNATEKILRLPRLLYRSQFATF